MKLYNVLEKAFCRCCCDLSQEELSFWNKSFAEYSLADGLLLLLIISSIIFGVRLLAYIGEYRGA